jgi:polyribonucleotide nucleotidyltransferase
MGLVYAEGKYTTLTDILGAEDAFGDMDFKVAGTAEFVTALQLDTKIDGIPADVLAQALHQAKDARMKILDVMRGAIAEPRAEVRDTAPKIVSFEIPIDKIGEVIGPKGKVINTIQQETGADITVADDDGVGIVSIGSKDGAAVTEARRRIELILDPPTAELGAVYEGRVVNITKFGAFVNILPGRDGLVHISKLGRGKRIDRVEDVLSLGDEVSVRVDDIDQNGKLSLSMVGDDDGGDGGGSAPGGGDAGEPRDRPARAPREGREREGREREGRGSRGPSADTDSASFEAFWEEQARDEFGDLGPGEEPAPAPAGGRDRGNGRPRGRSSRGGRGRGPRRS